MQTAVTVVRRALTGVMSLLGDRSASFIVRIWREENEQGGSRAVWRGSIESVRSGVKMYFTDVTSVGRFVSDHLGEIGITPAEHPKKS